LVIVRDGTFVLPHRGEPAAAVKESPCVTGIHFDRLVGTFDYATEISVHEVYRAPIDKGFSQRWVELDCLIEIVKGAVELLLHHIHEAAVGEGGGKCGIALDRPIIVLDSTANLAFVPVSVRTIDEGFTVRGIELDRLIEVDNGTIELAPTLVGGSSVGLVLVVPAYRRQDEAADHS
jgi:hypothetical protein